MSQRRIVHTVAAIVFLCAIGSAAWWLFANEQYAEAATIGRGAVSFSELESRFKNLAEDKGGSYAYEVLRRAQLPPGTDVHLLGHAVGDELYKQKGIDGIAVCTQEFRNACSHTVVIGALTEYGGEAALSKIRDACQKAPGGSGAYTMCYHGLGHGVFAFFGYDLEKTVEFCAKTGTAAYDGREYTECVGGAIMELMSGGAHDRDLWLVSREKHLSDENPLAPCDAAFLPDETRTICYVYLTPHLFEVAGADLAQPRDQHFAAAFVYCDAIPEGSVQFRDACFGGIGKEFPALAMARDVRDMSKATDAQLSQMRTWCGVAPHEEARLSCEKSVLESLFWGGENDPRLSTRYCALADKSSAAFCFGTLVAMADAYLERGVTTAQRLCAAVPAPFAADCREKLL